jgi:hypothetical protein
VYWQRPLFYIHNICYWLHMAVAALQVGLLHSITSFWGWSAMKLIVVLPYLDACDFYPIRNYCCFYGLWYSWVFLKLCFLTGGHSITSFLSEVQKYSLIPSTWTSRRKKLKRRRYKTTNINILWSNSLRFISILSTNLSTGLLSDKLPLGLLTKIKNEILVSFMRNTWSMNSILLDLIKAMICGKQYKL